MFCDFGYILEFRGIKFLIFLKDSFFVGLKFSVTILIFESLIV